MTFATPRINGKSVDHPKVSAIYPLNVPDYADASALNGGVVVHVGRPVQGRTERHVELIGEGSGGTTRP